MTVTVQKTCAVTAGSGSNIDLGTVASTATNLSGNSTISVNCSKATPYYIGLLPSAANGGNTAGLGYMAGTGAIPSNTDKIAFQLRSTSGAAGTIWGNTATSSSVGNGVAGTGTGAAQSITVYVTVASVNYTADSYADTVTVTVNY